MKRAHVFVLSLVMLFTAGCAVATILPDGRVLFINGIAKIFDPGTGVLHNATIPVPPRTWSTATLLNDGHVLLAGGVTGQFGISSGSSSGANVSSSASLYDPTNDSYSQTGQMLQPRVLHSATLLQDGRVLIAGGSTSSLNLNPTGGSSESPAPSAAPVTTAELYDPGSGTFSPTGALATGRSMHTATLLQDGRVLIVGGLGADSKSLDSAELYDPQSGTFTATGPLTAPRAFDTATLLNDGTVLVVGGTGSGTGSGSPTDPATTSAELYNPGSGTFTKLAKGPLVPRLLHTATLLNDGRVLITGGIDTAGGGSMLTSAELYDPQTQTFTKTGDMVQGRAFHVAVKIPDGRVVLAGIVSLSGLTGGGSDSSGNSTDPLGSAEIYDPASGTFSAVTVEPMPSFSIPPFPVGSSAP